MNLTIDHYEPIKLPTPYTSRYHLLERRRFKQLGISPSVENGIRTWRVIWRPFLSCPVTYRRPDGTPGIKRKSDEVRTMRFPIVGNQTEESAYRRAMNTSSMAYRLPLPKAMPLVDWSGMARARGVKLRSEYARPSLNGAISEAQTLFEAGYGVTQVAHQMGVNKSTACRWRQKLRKEKALP